MYKAILSVIWLLLIFPLNDDKVFCQESPVLVTRSNDRVVIEGKVYYIHVVRKGETLYSLSRAYEVTQQEIIAENPGVQSGLRIEQALKIPNRPSQAIAAPPPSGQILHQVEAGQTLYSISRLYSVSIDEIVSLNPGADQVLRTGDTLRIPGRTVTAAREGFPDEDQDFLYHKVEKGETLFSLSQRYGVSVRDIRRANRILIWGLRAGDIIRIPRSPDFPEELPPSDRGITDYESDTLYHPEAGTYDVIAPESECLAFDYFRDGRSYNIALFLPLSLDRNFQSETSGALPSIQSVTLPYLEFYEGVLVAVDSLKKSGLSLNLYVYDSDRNPGKIQRILGGSEFSSMDLIIGPFFPDELRLVSEFARDRKIPVVTPLTTRAELLKSNPLLYQVTPSSQAEIERASRFLTGLTARNFVIVHRNETEDLNHIQRFKDQLTRYNSSDTGLYHVVIKEVVLSDNLAGNLEQSFVKGEQNIVIIISRNQAFLADVLNRLNVLSMSYPLTVLGLHDWQKFPNLDVEFYHNLQIHFSSPFFVDFNKPEVQNFLSTFRNRFKTEPIDYGFLGFDIAFYFLSAMMRFGPEFSKCLSYQKIGLTQSEFSFRKVGPESGFENKGLSIIRYNKDYSISNLGTER